MKGPFRKCGGPTDSQELERLAAEHADMICRISLNDTCSPADAEDVL